MKKAHNIRFERSSAILRVKRRLESQSFPRLQMTLIVALTGAIGLLASFALLRMGVESMAVRYPFALTLSYLFFLFLIWLWLRTKATDYLDVPDLPGSFQRSGSVDAPSPTWTGGGGEFGGGGASGSFDGPSVPIGETSNSLSSVGDAADAVGAADELAIPLIVVALAIALAIAAFYIIYIAPIFFAEVLVDGALSFALFRYLRGHDPRHWLATSFRHTVVPFAVTALFMALAGVAMTAYAPGARSIGEVVHYSR
jgi:hypothetical protein